MDPQKLNKMLCFNQNQSFYHKNMLNFPFGLESSQVDNNNKMSYILIE